MNRTLFVALAIVCGVSALIVASKRAESGAADALVRLQASSPGAQQIGSANLSGTFIAGQLRGGGAGITALHATNIASGTLADARLSSNVALLSGAQSFSGAKTFAVAPSFTAATPFAVTGTGNVANLNADLLDGLDSSAFLQSIPVPLTLSGSNPAGHIVSATNTSQASSSIAVVGISTGIGGTNFGVYGQSDSVLGGSAGLFGIATATSTSGSTYGVYGANNSPTGAGVRGNSADNNGVEGYATSTTGINRGVYGHTYSSSGVGVEGWAVATTGSNFGGRFSTVSVSGIGVAGVSPNTGVSGEASSTGGRGVFGTATSTTGTTYGGRFETDSINGRGVYGYASATGATDTPYGVRGQASTTTLGYAVYAVGDLGASGVKPFRIDHPLDPANKYLLHYSSESPFPQNFYNGNVTTDSEGYAWVELPEYFAEINTNFKYILTVVDDMDSEAFVQAKISKKIKDNRFQIRTSAPNVEVSWEVKADRNDQRVRYNRPTDVREKSGPEKGKYQHPEYYGLGPDRGMDYAPVRQ